MFFGSFNCKRANNICRNIQKMIAVLFFPQWQFKAAHIRCPKKTFLCLFSLDQNRISYLNKAQKDKQLQGTFLWDTGTFFGTPDTYELNLVFSWLLFNRQEPEYHLLPIRPHSAVIMAYFFTGIAFCDKDFSKQFIIMQYSK